MLNKKTYNKLVRDKIPEILDQKNIQYKSHVANQDEYLKKLQEKLKEEVEEFIEDNNENELADIIEVINALVALKGYSHNKIELIRNDKAKKRGVFKKR